MSWLQLLILLVFLGTWFVTIFIQLYKINELLEQAQKYIVQSLDISNKMVDCMALLLGEKIAEREEKQNV